MSQPRDDRQDDLFRPPLKEIINLCHPLVRLAGEIELGVVSRIFRTFGWLSGVRRWLRR